MKGTIDISVIIPCLNEEKNLSRLFDQLENQRDIELEIVLVDGGSTDDSVLLSKQRGVRVCRAPKGRGLQMNKGARLARGGYFFFLHGDSELREDDLLSGALLELKKLNEVALGGHFGLRFIRQKDNNHFGYRYAEEKTFLNRPYTINGDQGLLIHREFFEELGGFDENVKFMEDQVIAEKIFKKGRWVQLPGVLYTSARRFEREGFFRRYILMGFMMGLHYSGLRRFFELAPQVYREQGETKTLYIYPFYKVADQLFCEFGRWRAWYRIGRHCHRQCWQVFYFLDQCLRPLYRRKSYPLVFIWDKFLYPLTNHALGYGVVTVGAYFLFFVVIRCYFYFRDGR